MGSETDFLAKFCALAHFFCQCWRPRQHFFTFFQSKFFMKNSISRAFVIGGCLLSSCLFGQNNTPLDKAAKATEFAIPASPAFNMLNENVPSRIQRYASLHDFKVDWSMTNGRQGYSLSPGIAIEAQPIWLLFFDRAGAAKYRSATSLTRTLSTLSVSLGTNASNDKNWLAWGAKLTLYRENDPLNDTEFLKVLEASTEDSKDSFLLIIKELEKSQIRLDRRKKDYDLRFNAFEDTIMAAQFDIQEMERKQSQKLAEARENYIQKNWNSSYVDVAFGRLQTYKTVEKTISKLVTDPATGRDTTLLFGNNTLELNGQGYGIWLSGGIGIGQNVLLSAMGRYGKKPSETSGNLTNVMSVGANLRYGTRRYNFFIEGFYDRASDPLTAFGEAKFERQIYMMTFGGDWRISKNVMLSFGIRQTRDFENGSYFLQPLMNVNCLMR
jgi:hypothetical protein